jgi:hypothetical protein
MKRFLIALALLPALALGAANDIVTNQRNATDTSSIPRTVAKPPGTQDGLMGFNGATVLPVHWTIGTGLQISSGALVALPQAWADITGKPSFATVATSGAYADLTGRPSLFSGAYGDLTGIPSTFTPSAHTHAAADVTSGTFATARIPALPISQTTGLQAALDGKYPIPTGTTAQYVRGDGTLATLPVAKRIEAYPGTTNASGQIVVTYSTAFPSVPVVQPPAPALASQVWTTVSSTTTGFTLQLNQRNVVTLLGIEVLLGATVPVSGATATILVVAQ